MNCFNKTFVTALVGLAVAVSANNVMAKGGKRGAFNAEACWHAAR